MKIALLVFLTFALLGRDVAADQTITVTGHPDYPPVIWKSKKTNRLMGISIELTEKIFKEIGIKTKFIPISTWARSLEEVKDGKIDILLPPYINEKRLKVYTFSDQPFLMDKSALFVRKGFKLDIKDFKELKKYKGVSLINDSFGDYFDNLDRKVLKVKRLVKTDQCLRFVLKNRADYLVAGYNAAKSVAAANNISDKFDVHPTPIIETGMYIGVSKKSHWNRTKILNHINNYLAREETKKMIQELEDKYFKLYQQDQN